MTTQVVSETGILPEAVVYTASNSNGRCVHWTGYITDRRLMRVVWNAGPPTVYGPASDEPNINTADRFAWDNLAYTYYRVTVVITTTPTTPRTDRANFKIESVRGCMMIFGFILRGFPPDPRGFRSDPRVESIQTFFCDFSTPKFFYY